MAQNQIRGGQVRSGTIVNEQIASNAEIALSKIAGGVALDNRVTDLESDAIVTREVPSGSVNGSNVTFTLANTPVSGTEQVYLNGLLQDPGAGNSYTISGAVITFLSAPLTGDEIHVTYGTDSYVTDPSGTPVSSGVDYGAVLSTEFSIAAGYLASFFVKSDNTLFSTGFNNYGQLGVGDTTDRFGPTKIGSSSDWSKVFSGTLWDTVGTHTHSAAIKTNGTLWAWGGNNNGQVGDGTSAQRNSPVQVGSDTNWSMVSLGNLFTIGVKTNGTLWGWGLGNASRNGSSSGTSFSVPTQIGSATNWSRVASGDYHTIALKTNGTLWSWGGGLYGALGFGNTNNVTAPTQIGSDTWVSISAGWNHSVGVKSNGTLWAWGGNSYNQLGDGTSTQRNSPVQIGSDTNWSKVFCGFHQTFAIKTDGTLWAWGRNNSGQLGDSTTTQRSTPVKIGTSTDWSWIESGVSVTVAAKSDGTTFAWGSNAYGALGDGTSIDRFSPANSEVDLKN